jgi:signal transduction histidine kinase
MDRVLRDTKKRFVGVLLILTCLIVATIWGVLQTINVTQIGSRSNSAEVHANASKSQELAAYINDQKAYEAHFVTLASAVKNQEKNRLTVALGVTAVGVLLFGSVAAYLATKLLMKPVEDAYTSQERFLQDAAHELRNPLAALTIALQQHKGEEAVDRRLLDTFRRQTRRLVQINEDLLFLERKSQEKLSTVNLSDLLPDVLEDLSISANNKHIVLDLRTDSGISKTMAASDYVRVLKNVLDNAIKYSPAKSKVHVRQTISKGTIKIIVQDSGIGIPKTDLAKIGDRFFRAKNVGTVDGTGLGIAIIKKILNSYGGTYAIASTQNQGTTVTITLPA